MAVRVGGRGPGHITRIQGVGAIFDFTIIGLSRVIGPNTRFIDTRR